MEQKQIDAQNHMLGRYVRLSILSTIGNSTWFKSKSTPPFEYPERAFLEQKDEEQGEKEKNGNVESQEEIAVFEMKQRIRQLNKQGLPESPM